MSKHNEIVTGRISEWQAESLLTLVKDHKKNCNGECGVSLYLLFPLYRKLKGEGAIQDMEHFI